MKRFALGLCLIFLALGYARAQERWVASQGEVQFNASTPLEDIRATNAQPRAVFDPGSGNIAVIVFMADFQFRRKLMQEHFNENYMESHRYPKGTFTGTLTGYTGMEPGQTRACQMEGTLTLHGQSRPLATEGKISRTPNGWQIQTEFSVHTADFGIDIPRLVFKKIAEDVTVQVRLGDLPLNNE